MDQIVDDHWVELAELSGLERLAWADAGNSTLWRCRLRGVEYVFKQYSVEFRTGAQQHALGGLIAWRDGLARHDRDHLDAIAAWPRYRVRQRGILEGVLLPFAAREFFQLDRIDGAETPRTIAHLQHYKADRQVRTGASLQVKCLALGHAAEALLWFHDHNVVVNDLRELNILSTLDGQRVYYVDCDAMMGPWGEVSPAAAPGYLMSLLPRSDRADRRTDLCRLAWLAIWLLLDQFGLMDPPMDKLRRLVADGPADLLRRTSKLDPFEVAEWRRLADRWVRTWTGTAPVMQRAPQPTLPQTLPMPERRRQVVMSTQTRGWLPAQYRQPALPPAPAPPLGDTGRGPAQDARRREPPLRLIAFVAVAVLATCAVLSLLVQGGAP
ncbi:hypothetical protein GCM10023170_020550 [Phytohabitans houttuyneae]|uniref:hypothetical protein n=1 Tax=Phytohabitans houttuyneae TaxID=1076126 RepID=UPI0031ED3706